MSTTRQGTPRVAIDIETVPLGEYGSALDPDRGAVEAFGAWGYGEDGQPVRLALHVAQLEGGTAAEREKNLLVTVAETVSQLGAVEIIGWNSSAFDMPFLARRYVEHGLGRLAPQLVDTGRVGKYGTPIYEAAWLGLAHRDICEEWQELAEEAGVRWSLKPVATACGLNPIEVDQTKIAEMSRDEVLAYQLSDVRVTYELDSIPPHERAAAIRRHAA